MMETKEEKTSYNLYIAFPAIPEAKIEGKPILKYELIKIEMRSMHLSTIEDLVSMIFQILVDRGYKFTQLVKMKIKHDAGIMPVFMYDLNDEFIRFCPNYQTGEKLKRAMYWNEFRKKYLYLEKSSN
jgi:hypothetical protein